jgi:enoyl-CoA hydratase/carnithine racemase
VITIDRPEARNAVDGATARALATAQHAVAGLSTSRQLADCR